MTGPVLDFASRSDRGKVRPRNEDSVVVHADAGVVIIADGIGGASSGDVASRMATEIIGQRFLRQLPSRVRPRRAQLLAEAAVDEANGAIINHAKNQARCAGMGTTVVVGYFGCTWLAYAHVGDSRLYRLRARQLVQLTSDHSFIQEVVDQGFFPDLDEARRYGINDNVLTRAVGSTSHVVAPTAVTDLAVGDIYLFCTDGLTGMVPDDELRLVLSAVQGSLGIAADALVHLACDNGGADNITLALVRVKSLGDDAGEEDEHSEDVSGED
jgi:protein phosphatase